MTTYSGTEPYFGSTLWYRDADRADTAWTVRTDLPLLSGTRIVRASASTGSLYSVVVTDLGIAQKILGAAWLVSVTSPWSVCYPLQPEGLLHWHYVLEKFVPGNRNPKEVHAGDLVALTKTIAYALGRLAVLPEYREEER